jgi:Tol biopolymer transport system component
MPTGKLVFAAGTVGDYDIYLYDLTANNLTQLTADTAWNDYPRFSPDATKIAYGSTRSGKQEIWLMNADGTDAKSLTANLKWADFPTWSPDGNEIAFVSNEYFQMDLFTLQLGTGKLYRLTDDDHFDCYPDWSPDGKTVAFSSQRGAHQDIYTLDLETREEKRITAHPGPDTSPAFSPDGTKVAFVSQRPDQKFEFMNALEDFFFGSQYLDIWTAEVATGNVKQMTTNRGVDRNVRWSPDGKCLAYTSSSSDRADPQVMILECATGKATPLRFDKAVVRREVERPFLAELNKPPDPNLPPLQQGKLDQKLENLGQKMMPSIQRMTPAMVNELMGKYRQWVIDGTFPIAARYLDWK